MNSDASLDLTQIAGFFVPRLRSTISTPLVKGDSLLGVLTAYSTKRDAFDDQHRYAFEEVGTALVAVMCLPQPARNVVAFSRHHS